jgi:hypothetical protein
VTSSLPLDVQAQNRFGVEGIAVSPTSDLNSLANPGGGAGAFFDLMASSDIAFRFDAAYLKFGNQKRDDVIDTDSYAEIVPLRTGVCIYTGPIDVPRFYVGSYLGLYVRQFKVRYNIDNGNKSDGDFSEHAETKVRFGFAPMIGGLFPLGSGDVYMDLGASYDFWFGEDNFTPSFLRLDLGVAFRL